MDTPIIWNVTTEEVNPHSGRPSHTSHVLHIIPWVWLNSQNLHAIGKVLWVPPPNHVINTSPLHQVTLGDRSKRFYMPFIQFFGGQHSRVLPSTITLLMWMISHATFEHQPFMAFPIMINLEGFLCFTCWHWPHCQLILGTRPEEFLLVLPLNLLGMCQG